MSLAWPMQMLSMRLMRGSASGMASEGAAKASTRRSSFLRHGQEPTAPLGRLGLRPATSSSGSSWSGVALTGSGSQGSSGSAGPAQCSAYSPGNRQCSLLAGALLWATLAQS